MLGYFSLLWLGHRPASRSITVQFFFPFARATLMNSKRANLFAVLPTISLCDNHIRTVQMRKWLIRLVINIMSYYPGQRNYFIKPGYIYLCSPMHLFCSFHSVLFPARLLVATRWLVLNSGNKIGFKFFPFVLENAYSWVPMLSMKSSM